MKLDNVFAQLTRFFLVLTIGMASFVSVDFLNHLQGGYYTSPLQSTAMEQPNNVCDKTVKTYRPSYAPSGWKIQCVNSISSVNTRELPPDTAAVFGITYPSFKVIQISRLTPVTMLRHVIDHEWAHADVAHDKVSDDVRWQMWVKFVHANLHRANVKYLDDPDEILADNTAKCYLNEESTLTGVQNFDCHYIWRYFPEFNPSQSVV